MKSKLLTILTAIILSCLSLFGLTACEEPHEHSYTQVVTPPTCEAQGFTTNTCECGDVVIDTYVNALGHSFTTYVSDNNATFESDGTKTAKCDVSGCNKTKTIIDVGSKLTYTSETAFVFESGTITGLTKYGKTLDKIYIPKTINGVDVTSIGNQAFYDCSKLMSIEIPNSITSIGSFAFSRCSSLTSINVDSNSSTYKSTDGNLYSKDGKTLIQYAIGKPQTSFKVPNSVTSIGELAFYNCSSLTSIEIPNSITSIGSSAFSRCSSLTSIVIPSSVTSIGSSAFEFCSSLTSIEIPDSVTRIDGWAFYDCYSLTSIVIPDSVTSIGSYAFYSCSSLTSIVIPDSVTSIGSYAFEYCSSLTSIVIPDSVTSIGFYAFASCDSLTSIVIPDSVTSIGAGAFKFCSSLTSIVIPDSVTSIGSSMFDGCSKLYVEKGYIRYIKANGNDYFMAYEVTNENMSSYTIQQGTKFLGADLFSNCDRLSTITIPDSVTRIGSYAFAHCDSLTSIEIPDRVTSIGNCAFEFCKSLTSIKYRGTSSQWLAISKGAWWNYDTGNYTITYNYTGD